MLVGDILLSAREAVPDLPGTLVAPQVGDIAVSVVGSANPLPAGTYYMQLTYGTLWGETNPAAETNITLISGQALRIDATNSPYLNVIAFVNVYTGVASGAEIRQYNLLLSTVNPVGVIDATTPFSIAPPPQGNGAFLLDSGGPVASAAQIFRWFRDALNSIAAANGGVPDTCGFPTVLGKALYTLPGDWKDIDAAWYDGYPVFLGSGKQVYRHNPLTSVSGMMSYSQVANQLVCEMFPQPVRTAGTGTLVAALALTDTQVLTNGFNGFVLSFGLVQLGAGSNVEFVSYTASGNSLTSMVRGLGGTTAQAWPINTPMTEMNVMFAGWRAPILYYPGMAATVINLPSDWVPLLHKYLLSRYRLIEQQDEDAVRLEKEFFAGLASATKRKSPIGERQIQPLDTTMVDVFPGLSRTFGGLIVP